MLVAIALVVNLAVGQVQAGVRNEFDPELAELFHIGASSIDLKIFLVVASLFLVRDCLLVMTLNFGRRRRRADLAALVYLAALYVIVPLLVRGLDLDQTILMKFFLPQVDGGLAASAWPVVLEVAGLTVVMVLRWRAVRQPLAADAA